MFDQLLAKSPLPDPSKDDLTLLRLSEHRVTHHILFLALCENLRNVISDPVLPGDTKAALTA
ncbi:hypothetical protein D3C71_1402780 [compost metagenome]